MPGKIVPGKKNHHLEGQFAPGEPGVCISGAVNL